MANWIFPLLLLLLVQKSKAQEIVNLTILEEAVEQGAVCLDGSPPAYFFRRGSSRNWLVFMQGGSWCYGDSTERSCLSRSKTSLGSSTQMNKQFTLNFGIFNISKIGNPDFWNWNHVWINSCDGGSFSGNVDKPVPISNTNQTLYYRGLRIWKFIMEDLMKKGLKHSNKAILLGCSAGGVATALLCNDFRNLLPQASVKCFMDGGFITDQKDLNGNYSLRSIMKAVCSEHNITIGMRRHFVPHNAAYKQLFPQYLLKSIKPPLFILNSAYDTWQIRNVLLYPVSDWRLCVEDPDSCQSSQLKILQGFRVRFLELLAPVFKRKDSGMFINSCFHHCQGDVTLVKVFNQTILETLGDWTYNRKPAKAVDHFPWPTNPTCVTFFEDSWL